MKNLQIIIASVGAYLGWALGGWDGYLFALVAFVTADYLTGVAAAICEKKLSSAIGYKGILKKILIFIVVFMANIIDTQLIQNGSAVRTAIIFYYVYNEGISILENMAKTGLPISPKIIGVLEQLGGDENEVE